MAGIKLDLLVLPARVQGIEIGDAVDPEHDRLAVDHKLLEPIPECRLDDPGIAVSPVVAAAGDQAHAIPLALQAEAVTVVFHLVESDRMVRDGGRAGRQAKLEGARHCWNGMV